MNKRCLVFLTHRLDDSMIHYIAYLKKSVIHYMNFKVIYDVANGGITNVRDLGEDCYIFNSRKCKEFYTQGNRCLPNPLFPLFSFARDTEYEHFLYIENDIVLNGDFGTFVKSIPENIDYAYIKTDCCGGPENHWPVKLIQHNPFRDIKFAWSQLFYVSRNFLSDVEIFMQKNKEFHFEFLLPTLAYSGNYSILKFEDLGYSFDVSWGPAEEYERRYVYNKRPNTFYHPIKNLGLKEKQISGGNIEKLKELNSSNKRLI